MARAAVSSPKLPVHMAQCSVLSYKRQLNTKKYQNNVGTDEFYGGIEAKYYTPEYSIQLTLFEEHVKQNEGK